LWLSGQITLGAKIDLLTLAQLRVASDESGRSRFGIGLERKAGLTDLRAELYYDTWPGGVQGGISVETRLLNRLTATASVALATPVTATHAASQLNAYVQFRWFVAEDL
jgi:hypothetical protein